ncbi:hypothetical protein Tco_0436647 [Tanacetum coccineum]
MAEQNVPTQPPTRTDEQIVPRSQWLTIGKSNLLFNAQKIQKNPIFQISVDILSNTNFFQAFTASANVPAIYLQQFWNTMKYNEKTGVYSCQVDEQWFDLSADLLRKALAITPVIPAHPFELPPSGNTVIDFVNELGYPEPVEIVSNIRVNYVYQPWRAILTLINQCLTGKTSGSDKPRHPVLQMLWGIVTQTNVDHAELLWEEFTQGIQTFFSHKASHKASLKDPKKKVTPLLIPYGRFSKVIIYYLASNNNIHRRPDSAVHHTGDDFLLGNLKFVPKGETVEVFGMAIPDPLITEAIQQSSYYPKYLEMVAKNTKKTPQESASKQPATKRAPPKKPTTTTPVKPSKPAPAPTKKPLKQPQGEGDDPDLELDKKVSLDEHQEKREGGGIDADLEKVIKLSLDPSFFPQGQPPVGGLVIRDQVSETIPKLPEVVGKGKAKTTGPSSQPEDDTSEKVVQESSSTTDSERTESGTDASAPKVEKEQGEVTSSTVTSGVVIPTGLDSGKEHVSLAGPNPEHMDEDFYATAYPKVHENLKLRPDEHVTEENPESHSGSMSSMKNLEDTDTYGDLFLNDKPTEDDQEKTNVADETKTDTSTPLVTAPIVEISSPKPSSQVTTLPINTEATTITTTLPEITPFIALQMRVAKLELDMAEVKKTDHSAAVLASIESQVPTVVDNYLGDKVDNALLKALKRHTEDLIRKYSELPGPESSKKPESSKRPVSEKSRAEIIRVKKEQEEQRPKSSYTIKATDTTALKEFDLKAALFKTMNENKSANINTANYYLYHALIEALIEDENAIDKEVTDKVKDHKRKHDSDDDEDDEGPSAGSNQGKLAKRRRPNSGTFGSAQPPLKDDDQSSKKPRESDPESEHSKQSSDDIPMQDEGHVSDLEDTNNAHIPKNNWANTYATTYQVPAENKLQRKAYDIGLFIKWFCRRTGEKKLCKADLEGPAFNLVKAFHKNNVESERDYDISAAYGITHWWFRRKEFYINKHSEPSDREAVRFQMRILSVINVKEKDFKNLHPNDFEDLFLLNIQEKLSHLPKTNKTSLHTAVNMWIRNLVIRNRVGDLQLGIESYQTKINLERPNWDAADYYFKEDYTIVPKPRAVVYRDINDQRKLMRLNELHKFSDGTLTRVMEKLDHMVKDFHLFEYNKGIETRKWSENDKRRSKNFITAIEKRLQTRRIFRSLESFDILKMEMEMEIPSVKASANSDVMYSFTSAQDGNPLQDDVRLCLGDDLKKAQDHSQRQAKCGVLGVLEMDGMWSRYGVTTLGFRGYSSGGDTVGHKGGHHDPVCEEQCVCKGQWKLKIFQTLPLMNPRFQNQQFVHLDFLSFDCKDALEVMVLVYLQVVGKQHHVFATTPLICLECIKEGRDDNGTSVIGASESVNSTSYALFEDKSILGDQGAFGKLLEEKPVTWAQFGKKFEKNTTFKAGDSHPDAFIKSA